VIEGASRAFHEQPSIRGPLYVLFSVWSKSFAMCYVEYVVDRGVAAHPSHAPATQQQRETPSWPYAPLFKGSSRPIRTLTKLPLLWRRDTADF
jgi:hypothetical protein